MLLPTGPCSNQVFLHIIYVKHQRIVNVLLHHAPDLVVNQIQVTAVWCPVVWDNELQCHMV